MPSQKSIWPLQLLFLSVLGFGLVFLVDAVLIENAPIAPRGTTPAPSNDLALYVGLAMLLAAGVLSAILYGLSGPPTGAAGTRSAVPGSGAAAAIGSIATGLAAPAPARTAPAPPVKVSTFRPRFYEPRPQPDAIVPGQSTVRGGDA